VAEPVPLNSTLLRERSLPAPSPDADKNARGRVLAVGGCAGVPGGLALTCEAALRAGAGKVQAAVPHTLALAMGMALPEIGVIALPEDQGEIADAGPLAEPMGACDAVIAGPAMIDGAAGGRVVAALLEHGTEAVLVLDAAALTDLHSRAAALRAYRGGTILTPHVGEMAALLECDAAEVETDREGAARRAAERYGAVALLKGSTTFVAAPDGQTFAFAGGGVGLATGGSGDVMGGLAAGLAARGAEALDAALWAVWLHGEAGRRCAEQVGPLGFLARELLAHVPGLMRGV
jgi:hydroxyethylthiazole kinase-like uncharacterized protein yjeF